MPTTDDSYRQLLEVIQRHGRSAVAFSGGVDSTLLLYATREALGVSNTLACTVCAPMHLQSELSAAVDLAASLGIRHHLPTISFAELPELADNPHNRCYLCKKRLLNCCLTALPHDFRLCEGSNSDDLTAYRPGWQAVQELRVASPLVEAGLSKETIRAISRMLHLPTWNKPAQSCLLTRFPHDTPLTEEQLHQVAAAEEAIVQMGFSMLRLRSIGELARLEFHQTDLPKAQTPQHWQQIVAICHAAGYRQVTCDPAGYRSGSMD